MIDFFLNSLFKVFRVSVILDCLFVYFNVVKLYSIFFILENVNFFFLVKNLRLFFVYGKWEVIMIYELLEYVNFCFLEFFIIIFNVFW